MSETAAQSKSIYFIHPPNVHLLTSTSYSNEVFRGTTYMRRMHDYSYQQLIICRGWGKKLFLFLQISLYYSRCSISHGGATPNTESNLMHQSILLSTALHRLHCYSHSHFQQQGFPLLKYLLFGHFTRNYGIHDIMSANIVRKIKIPDQRYFRYLAHFFVSCGA